MLESTLQEVLAAVARLEARVAEQDVVIAVQAARIVELEAQNAELRRRLGMDSTTSSVPSSRDPIGRPGPVSTRRRSGRRPGRRPGGEGVTLAQVDVPDEVVEHRPGQCGGCGVWLAGRPVVGAPVRRQVFDVPPVRVHVTEHRLERVARGCGTLTRAHAPAGVNAPCVYGPGVTALAVYFHVAQLVPVARTATVLADVLGIPFSAGWVATAVATTATRLGEASASIRGEVNAAPVVGVDEACTKIGGKQQWLWTAVTDRLTAFHADAHSRSRVALTAFGILENKPAAHTVVHDGHPLYDSGAHAHLGHALCCAHLDRDLLCLVEFDPAARREGWAGDLRDLLADAYRWRATWAATGAVGLPEFKLGKLRTAWDQITARARAAHPHVAGRKGGRTRARNLALRITTRREDYLAWASDFTIPFSNNASEQAIRMIKVRTKIGAFRTLKGQQTFLTIRGWLDTARKHDRHLLTDLRHAATGHACTPAT